MTRLVIGGMDPEKLQKYAEELSPGAESQVTNREIMLAAARAWTTDIARGAMWHREFAAATKLRQETQDALASALEQLDVNVSFVKQYQTQVVNLKEQLEAARTDLATVGFQLVEDAEMMDLGAFRANAEERCVPIMEKQFGEEWWKFDGLLDKEPPAPEVK